MAAKRSLKVFRTSIGFEDAYIAAPSQRAALGAWGAERNLFAQGMAEVVNDPKLAAPALERPGTVLRVPRGTTAEHLAAATKDAKPTGHVEERRNGGDKPDSPLRKPSGPKPNKIRLDRAREKLEEYRSDIEARLFELDNRIAELRDEKGRLKAKGNWEIAKLYKMIKTEEAAYRQAVEVWEG